MRFLVRKRRATPTVIIVALIDVLIVLLIFLMVTTTFKQQPALKLALPESTQAQKTGADENAPFIIAVDEKGILHIGQDARPATLDMLKTELLVRTKRNPDLRLDISADKNAPVGQVVKIMDISKELKLKSVNLFTKEPTGQ